MMQRVADGSRVRASNDRIVANWIVRDGAVREGNAIVCGDRAESVTRPSRSLSLATRR
jgi:hypothetical protein